MNKIISVWSIRAQEWNICVDGEEASKFKIDLIQNQLWPRWRCRFNIFFFALLSLSFTLSPSLSLSLSLSLFLSIYLPFSLFYLFCSTQAFYFQVYFETSLFVSYFSPCFYSLQSFHLEIFDLESNKRSALKIKISQN